MFTTTGATIWVEYECENCGDSGSIEIVDADEIVGQFFGVNELECPKCGEELEKNE